MEPVIYKLKYPIAFGTRTIEEFKLERRPIVDDFEDTTQHLRPKEQVLVLARVAGLPPAVAKMVDGADMLGLCEVMTAFLQPGPETGAS
jgi:hypothetical protein